MCPQQLPLEVFDRRGLNNLNRQPRVCVLTPNREPRHRTELGLPEESCQYVILDSQNLHSNVEIVGIR